MLKKNLILGGILFLFLLLGAILSNAVCMTSNTPKIKPTNYFELADGELFEYDFELSNMDENDVTYTYARLDEQLTGIELSKDGVLKFTPSNDDVGVSRLAIIAVKETCGDTLIVTLRIYDRPDIIFYKPVDKTLEINQTDTVIFSVKAQDTDANDYLDYSWLLDDNEINASYNSTGFIFKPGFNVSGLHSISVKITDSHNLSEIVIWELQIERINRPPVLKFEVPNYIIFKNTASGAYDLNDYFYDPEGAKLNFSAEKVVPAFEVSGVAYANISATVAADGYVTYDPSIDAEGYAYFKFIAQDKLGKTAESNLVKVDVFEQDSIRDMNYTSIEDFCGDNICSAVESCDNCPYDCGQCQDEIEAGCKPDWECTEWTECLPAGFMTRNCTDTKNCDDERTMPDVVKLCIYDATCEDGLKNGIEEGVDCGGPCDPCPTCNDGIQNQGEEGVDCGGPCIDVCPSCIDGIKNQNESDIDCGGECVQCKGGQACLKNNDCESLRCEYLVCTYPSCDDQIKNQNEESIDCGGVCPKQCGNCSDGIQNRGEEGVDCGGLCRPCPNCFDNIKNQDEIIVDCGGSCRPCIFIDYFQRYLVIAIIIILLVVFLPVFLILYFYNLLKNPAKARKIYDSDSGFSFLIKANKFTRRARKLKGAIPVINEDQRHQFNQELTEMGNRKEIDDKELYAHFEKIFRVLLSLPEEYDDAMLITKLKASHVPFFMKVLMNGFYHKVGILAMATFVPYEQKVDMITELKFLLSELGKG